MRHADEGQITVQIGRFGSTPVTVHVDEDSTVEEALSAAGISPRSTETIWVDGDKANLNDIVEDGDTINIVTPKQAGLRSSDDESFISKVSKALRKVIGSAKADQIEAGYRNKDLSLTEKGKEALLSYMAEDEDMDKYLTELAAEEIADREKECKKNK